MKKTLFLFAGLALAGNAAFAENIAIDNRFVEDGKGGIEGWTFNNAEVFKPFGTVKAAMRDGMTGVNLISQGKYTAIYLGTQIGAKEGDVFRMTAKVVGKGRFGMGLYQYGKEKQWQWCGVSVKYGRANYRSPVSITFDIPVSSKNKKEVANICPALIADAGADVTFYDLKVEKVEK